MLANVGLYSYIAPALIYGGLAVALLLSWRGLALGFWLIAAFGLTGVWGATIAAGTLMEYPPVQLIQLAEFGRNASWLLFLIRLFSARFDEDRETIERVWLKRAVVGLLIAACAVFLAPLLIDPMGWPAELARDAAFASWLSMAIGAILLIEQLLRNATEGELWSLKYLCFGLLLIFGYDFFMYAEALLLRQLDPQLWQARGLVTALAAPLIAVSISRSRESQFSLQVSRKMVFHSLTLLGAGFYLLTMAVVGYFIELVDATWGGVLQVSFLVAAGALLLALLFSGQIRARMRVLLSKHFFSYKYDYREEWLKFTSTLAGIGNNAPQGIIRAMAPLVQSPGGWIWAQDDEGSFRLLANWQAMDPTPEMVLGPLPDWLEQSGWVIDLSEWRKDPSIYGELELPAWMQQQEDAWLITPLMFGDKLQAVLLLRRSELQGSINWEDRDLLKTAGRQAAAHLAQHLASQDLVEARQFEAFNRLSAYVIHDLKNILAQQSLIVANAQKHKDNPEFVDDMIATVNNSVSRMTKLMQQMRSGVRDKEMLQVDLAEVLQDVKASRDVDQPAVQLELADEAIVVEADQDRLQTVFSHLVKNAQEATGNGGTVAVRLNSDGQRAVVEVEDSGCGMDAEFVQQRLFKPFDSTKGLTGMGIGAFESREVIRSLGGDILVQSEPGKGSLFRVLIPRASNAPET